MNTSFSVHAFWSLRFKGADKQDQASLARLPGHFGFHSPAEMFFYSFGRRAIEGCALLANAGKLLQRIDAARITCL